MKLSSLLLSFLLFFTQVACTSLQPVITSTTDSQQTNDSPQQSKVQFDKLKTGLLILGGVVVVVVLLANKVADDITTDVISGGN